MESGQSAGGGYQAGVPDFNSREFKVLSASEILAYFLNSPSRIKWVVWPDLDLGTF